MMGLGSLTKRGALFLRICCNKLGSATLERMRRILLKRGSEVVRS